MTIAEWIRYLASWTALGATLFSVFAVIVMKTGLAYIARNRDGTLKRPVPAAGWLLMVATMLLFAGFFVAAARDLLVRLTASGQPEFVAILGGVYGLFLLLFLFDTLVVDFWVLGRWRPGFLDLPEEMGEESMARHIRASLPKGLVIGLLLSLLTSFLAWQVGAPD